MMPSLPTTTSSTSTSTSAWRRNRRPAEDQKRPHKTGSSVVTYSDVLLQQVINGISLGAMYSLLALGFTMVYGIIELINFAHFNVFMVGSFLAMWALEAMGFAGQSQVLYGLPLAGVLVVAFIITMLGTGI